VVESRAPRAENSRMTLKRRNSGLRSERGTVLIEFALVVPFLLAVTLCVVDLSRAFWVRNVATQAAREGVRAAVVSQIAPQDSAQTRVERVVSSAGVPLTSCELTDLGNRQMQLTVGVQFRWLYPGLFRWIGAPVTNPQTLTAVAVMRRED
jgi:TadE-like protein